MTSEQPSWLRQQQRIQPHLKPVEPPVHVRPRRAPGGADTPGRLIAQRLSEVLGQPFIFDYKPGADGITATDSATAGGSFAVSTPFSASNFHT